MQRLEKLDLRKKRVRALKILLPAVLVVTVASVYALYTQGVSETYEVKEASKEMQKEQQELVDETQSCFHSELQGPCYNGVDHQGRPYELKALISKEDETGQVYFESPSFKLTLPDGTWVALSSVKATLDKKTSVLELEGNVHLSHSGGYDFYTKQATLLLNELRAFNNTDVTGTGPMGKLSSKSFELFESGRKLRFKSQRLELNAS